MDTRGRGRGIIAPSRASKRSKFDTEEADLGRLENATSFMTLCGVYSSIFPNQLWFILIDSIGRTYGEPMAGSSGRGEFAGCGRVAMSIVTWAAIFTQ